MRNRNHVFSLLVLGIVVGGCIPPIATVLAGQSIDKADTPLEVAQVLDRIIQPRFQRFDSDVFGIRRIPPISGHDNTMSPFPLTSEEKRMLKAAYGAKRAFVLAFLHCAHPPASAYRDHRGRWRDWPKELSGFGSRPTLGIVDARKPVDAKGIDSVPMPSSHELDRQREVWEKIALNALPRLKKGESIDVEQGDWLLAMRPVRATKSECLGCHTQTKIGDPLGVMVYAVSKRNP